jgi:hypothetical protein
MPCLNITVKMDFDSDATGVCTRPGAQAKYDALIAAIAAARPFSVCPTVEEDGSTALRHLCAHPEGGQCPHPVEVGVRPLKRVAVPTEAVAEEIRK